MINPPYSAEFINQGNFYDSPSTVHVKNTKLFMYYYKYLIQQAISQFRWKMPDRWDADYFLYTLYQRGYISVFDSGPLFGVIPQQCTLYGLNVYYHPTKALIANPLLPNVHELTIGTECVVLKLQPDYSPITDKVSYYASMMALCDEAATINLYNSQLSYVFAAGDKAAAESFKKLYDVIHAGNPAVVIDKKLMRDDGSPAWNSFDQNIGQNYIVDRIQIAKENFKDQFLTDLGIPNANTQKRERLVVAEVKANQVETAIVPDLWLQHLQQECRRVNEKFGVELGVEWRYDPAEGRGIDNAGDDIHSGTV